MRRATIVGFALCLSPAIYAAGCAQQEDGAEPPSIAPRGGNASGGSGGADGGTTGKGGSTSGGSGGTTGKGGSPGGGSGGVAPEAGAGGAAEGGAGGQVYDGTCANQNHAQCDDDNACTDDACNVTTCQHSYNAEPCATDNDDCTDDVCSNGGCTHPDAGVCECEEDIECDDQDPCTDDACSDELTCEYTPNTEPCLTDDNECTDDVCGGGDCLHNPNTEPCGTDNNECTDDVCGGGTCEHNPNTGPCTDDGTDCTDEVCGAGICQHTNNMSCQCVVASDCDAQEDDPLNCTFNRCNQDMCDFVDNDSCDVGNDFVVNSFNSFADWTANETTPAGLPLVDTGMTNPNLEGNSNLYFADGDGASLIMDVPAMSMVGLDRLAIIIQSASVGTASMVSVGVYDGTWHDVVLADYGAITQNQYGTIEIPLLAFDVPLGTISQVRLVTAPTGGQREWRIDHIEVRDN